MIAILDTKDAQWNIKLGKILNKNKKMSTAHLTNRNTQSKSFLRAKKAEHRCVKNRAVKALKELGEEYVDLKI